MKSKSVLRSELENLVSHVDSQLRIYDATIKQLHYCLCDLYLWWVEASKLDGFLDELYAEFDIKTRNRGEENFVRVIRLAWRIDWDGGRGASLQKWSKALREIHFEYNTNKDKYRANALNNLILFISNNGGVDGLARSKEDAEDYTNDDGVIKKQKKKTRRNLESDEKLRHKNKELAELYFENQATALSKLNLQDAPIATNDKSYAVALIRKKRDGYVVLSVTEQEDLITEAMIRTYRRQQNSVPMTLRILSEIIQTQAYPTEFEKFRHSLSLRSTIKDENGKPMRQIRRLIYRSKTKDFLLSENRADCSVVTIAKPISYDFKAREDLFLSANDRTFIEQEIIQKRNLAFFETVGASELAKNKDEDVKASHIVMCKYKIDGYIRNLYFYKTTDIRKENTMQAIRAPKLVHSWSAEISKEWANHMNSRFLCSWLRSFGASVNQKKNQVLRLDLGKKISISFDGSGGVYSRSIEDFQLPNKVIGKGLKVHFHARDLIPTLCALAEQEIIGKVRLSANDDVLTISYKTQIMEYEISIPTAKPNGTRNKQAFTSIGGE